MSGRPPVYAGRNRGRGLGGTRDHVARFGIRVSPDFAGNQTRSGLISGASAPTSPVGTCGEEMGGGRRGFTYAARQLGARPGREEKEQPVTGFPERGAPR